MGKAPFLLVTKASTDLPTRGHHIDAFVVCLGLFAPSFCDQQHYSKRNLDLANRGRLPTAFRLRSLYWQLKYYLVL